MQRSKHAIAGVSIAAALMVVFMVGCGGEVTTPAPVDARQPPASLAAPTFSPPQQPVTAQTVDRLRLRGRLDQVGEPATVFAQAIAPDNSVLVGVTNEQILGWDLISGALTYQTARLDTTAVYFAESGVVFYAVASDGVVRVHDATSGRAISGFEGHADFSGLAAFSPTRDRLALVGRDGTVIIWDAQAAAEQGRIRASDRANATVFSQNGDLLALALPGGGVTVWAWERGEIIAEYAPPRPTSAQRLAFAPDDARLAIGTPTDMRMWDFRQQPAVPPIAIAVVGGAGDVLRFTPDGSAVIAGGRAGGLVFWETVGSRPAIQLPDTQGDRLAAAFSADGSLLITTALEGETIAWNLDSIGDETIQRAQLTLGSRRIVDLVWSGDGRIVAFFDASGVIYIWGIV